jgi:hypothetical protein
MRTILQLYPFQLLDIGKPWYDSRLRDLVVNSTNEQCRTGNIMQVIDDRPILQRTGHTELGRTVPIITDKDATISILLDTMTRG